MPLRSDAGLSFFDGSFELIELLLEFLRLHVHHGFDVRSCGGAHSLELVGHAGDAGGTVSNHLSQNIERFFVFRPLFLQIGNLALKLEVLLSPNGFFVGSSVDPWGCWR